MLTVRKILALVAMVVTVGLLGLTNINNGPSIAKATPALVDPTRIRACALGKFASGRLSLAILIKRRQCDDDACSKACTKHPEVGYDFGYCDRSDQCYCDIFLYPEPDYD